MSRLIDRVRAGTVRPSRLVDFMRDPNHEGPLVELARKAPREETIANFGLTSDHSDYALGAAIDRFEVEQQRARRAPPVDLGDLAVPAIVGDWVPQWLDGQERHLLETIPALARPYGEFWLECQLRGHRYEDLQPYYALGAVVREVPVDVLITGSERWGFDVPEEVRAGGGFTYQLDVVVEPTKGDAAWLGSVVFTTDKLGDVVRLDDAGNWSLVLASYHRELDITPQQELANQVTIGRIARPLLATWGFLNLERGVELVEREPAEKLSKKFEKSHGTPLQRYHELQLDDGLRQVVEDALRSGRTLAQALHTVRGHKVTYQPERPMFGIAGRHGTFYVGDHLRGSKEAGEVKKDYRVARPSADGTPAPARPSGDAPSGPGGVGR